MVPRLRIGGCAMNGIVSASSGARSATERAPLHRALPGHGADAEPAAPSRDVAELGEPVQVDQHRRRGEPEVHRRDQALPARERLGVAACSASSASASSSARGR